MDLLDLLRKTPRSQTRELFADRRVNPRHRRPRNFADSKVKFAAVGDGWLFPCADKDDHWPREIFGELYDRVERHAGPPHMKGGRFHPFGRKWATERKNMSLVDVMAAGGWRDAQTLHSCYQLATTDGMLEVMSTPVKLRDRKVSSK
jgi:hypothetical protein